MKKSLLIALAIFGTFGVVQADPLTSALAGMASMTASGAFNKTEIELGKPDAKKFLETGRRSDALELALIQMRKVNSELCQRLLNANDRQVAGQILIYSSEELETNGSEPREDSSSPKEQH